MKLNFRTALWHTTALRMLQYTVGYLTTESAISFFKGQVSSTDGCPLTTSTSILKSTLLPNDMAQQVDQKTVPLLLRFVPREEMLGVLDMGSQRGKRIECTDGRAEAEMVDEAYDAYVDILQCLHSPLTQRQPSVSPN